MMTDVVVKSLAVLGGGVGGGLGLGWLAALLMRATAVRKPPRWSVGVVRLLGGGICGWLVALWLFGGGGPGIGGTGGWGLGGGKGKNAVEPSRQEPAAKHEGKNQTPDNTSLRIEVLGDAALSELDIKANRRYRLETKAGTQLQTFDEVKAAIKHRQEEQPPLHRLKIVLYRDSPNEDVAAVRQLTAWARDLNDGKMKVDILKEGSEAARK